MRIGIIGSGFITGEFAKAVSEVEKAQIKAFYSRTKDKGELASRFGEEITVYHDMDQFLAAPDLDFIYIASPNSLHYSQAVKAMESGKNVILEKPFTTTVKETLSLISMAKEKGLYLFEAITTVRFPNYLELKKHLEKIGKIKLVEAVYCQYSSRIEALWRGENPNIFNPEFSGGALMDLNLYNIYFAYGLFGKPEKAAYYPVIYKNGIDTSGTAILTYPEMIVSCTASKETNGTNMVQIHGEKGYIYVHDGSNGKKAFTIYTKAGEELIDLDQGESRLTHELRYFTKVFDAGDLEACHADLNDTENVMTILCECRESCGLRFPADEQ